MKKLLPTIIFLVLLGTGLSQSYFPPSTRIKTWGPAGTNVGVRGGIPTTRTNIINVTLTPYFADNTGATDCTNAITSAINAAAANDIIYLPAGTYRTNNLGIDFNQNRNNITVRGDGPGLAWINGGALTKIDARGSYGISLGTDPAWASPTTITAGATQGSTSITVSSSAGFVAGRNSLIQATNDPSMAVVKVFGISGVKTYTMQVTAVVGNVLTIDPALPVALLSGSTIKQSQSNKVTGIGIENLCIDGSIAGGMSVGLNDLGNVIDSWLLNVKIVGQISYGAFWQYGSYLEARGCYIDGGGSSGTNHSGFLINSVSSSLVEDNILINSFPNLEVNFGTSGMVFAYNFCDGSIDNYGLDMNHGPCNTFNLYEGNITPMLGADGYFGTITDETCFRNWITGWNYVLASPSSHLVNFRRLSEEMNLVGNIIGKSGLSLSFDGVVMGLPNIGNDSFNGTADNRSATTADMTVGVVNTWSGTITTRLSATSGTITSTGNGTALAAHRAASLSNQVGINGIAVPMGVVSGDTFTIDSTGTSLIPLPALSSVVSISPSQDGIQNLDSSVSATILRKANYYYFSASIPGGESISPSTLDPSYFRTAKPAYFASLAWPAFDSTSLAPTYTSIPAGYRFVNNANPPASGSGITSSISGSVKLSGKVKMN